MYCTHCGREVVAHASFCPNCGGAQPGNVGSRRMIRPINGRKVGGVCIAIANYLNTDVTLIRVIAVLLFLASACFPVGLAYLICWLVIPTEEYAPPVPASAPAPPATPDVIPHS